MLADRMNRLGTETAFDVLVKAKALEAKGQDIVHLEIGEPDFDTPANIIEAGVAAMRGGFTHYGPAAGLPQLRETISNYINKTRNINTNPNMVVVTPGAKPIMFYVILALVNEGDEVLYPNPGFPIYESVINFVGAKAVPIPLIEEKDFRFDVDELESLITPKTKLLIMNSPQNPTGGVLTKEDLQKVAELAKKHDIWVLTDEVYSTILYDGAEFNSIASIDGMMDRTIILEGFSKAYAMTGWRIGYGVCNEELAAQIAKLQTNSNSCTAAFTQMACVEAYSGPQDDSLKMVAEFKKRRDVIVDGLNAIEGISCKKPVGAFYVFPNITGLGKSSEFLEDYFLKEAGVASLSGTSFGKYGQGYLRFSYANSIENIKKALERIEAAVKKLKS